MTTLRSGVLLALFLSAWLTTTNAHAQQTKDRQDPQSTYEPRSQPGIGQKFLEKLVGDWDVEKVFYPRSGEPIRAPGQCRQTMINDGRFLQSNFTFHDANGTTTGLGLTGFDPETGQFTTVWIDSRSTRMSLRQSKEKFNGEEIVLYSRSLQDSAPPVRTSRTNTHLENNGRRLIHRQHSINPDGTERLVMELIMTKKEK